MYSIFSQSYLIYCISSQTYPIHSFSSNPNFMTTHMTPGKIREKLRMIKQLQLFIGKGIAKRPKILLSSSFYIPHISALIPPLPPILISSHLFPISAITKPWRNLNQTLPKRISMVVLWPMYIVYLYVDQQPIIFNCTQQM